MKNLLRKTNNFKEKTFTSTALVICVIMIMVTVIGLGTAFAMEPIDPDKPVSLTVTFKNDGKLIPGAEFKLYRVADVADLNAFTKTSEFSAFTGEINGYDNVDEWDAVAQKLVEFIGANGIKPVCIGKTGNNGQISFPNDGNTLLPGLYLVVGNKTVIEDTAYTAKPGLICLPNWNTTTEKWEYQASMMPKYGKETIPTTVPETTTKGGPVIPQTGMLWWPVIALVIIGVLFSVIGLIFIRKNNAK